MAQEIKYRVRIRQKRFECVICLKKFQDGCALRRHNLVHTGEQPYACQLCDKRFARASNLTVHNRVHTGEKPYACQYCTRAFADSSQLKRHVRLHTGERPYACQHCDKRFSRSGCLVRHVRTHTGEKPYACERCSKTFMRVSHLRSHSRVHTGEKPYACQYCEKKFSYRASLVTHSRTHTGEKPYSCLLCGKTFSQITALKYHCLLHAGDRRDVAFSDANEKPFDVTGGNEVLAGSDALAERVRSFSEQEAYRFCRNGSPRVDRLTAYDQEYEQEYADEKPFDRLLGDESLSEVRIIKAECETDDAEQASDEGLVQSDNARYNLSTAWETDYDFSATRRKEFIDCVMSTERLECVPDEEEEVRAADDCVSYRSVSDAADMSQDFCSSVAVDTTCSEFCSEYKPDWKLLVQPFVKLFRLTGSDLAKKRLQASFEHEERLCSSNGSSSSSSVLETDQFPARNQILVDQKPLVIQLDVQRPLDTGVTDAASGADHARRANNESLSSGSSKRFECLLCFKRFTEAQSLRRHHLLHTGEQPYACQHCGKKFSRSSNLVVHSRVHTGERPYACQVCGRCFADSSRLRRHSQRHTGEKPFACQVCDKRFLQHVSLVEHGRIHTGEKPYACVHCDRSFARGSHLRRHYRIHTGERPYSCQLCGKTFSDISSHIKHRRVHTGEKPYACDYCGKRFRQVCGLRYHVRTHVGEQMIGEEPCDADTRCSLINTDEVAFGVGGEHPGSGAIGERIRNYSERDANRPRFSVLSESDRTATLDCDVEQLYDYRQAGRPEID